MNPLPDFWDFVAPQTRPPCHLVGMRHRAGKQVWNCLRLKEDTKQRLYLVWKQSLLEMIQYMLRKLTKTWVRGALMTAVEPPSTIRKKAARNDLPNVLAMIIVVLPATPFRSRCDFSASTGQLKPYVSRWWRTKELTCYTYTQNLSVLPFHLSVHPACSIEWLATISLHTFSATRLGLLVLHKMRYTRI